MSRENLPRPRGKMHSWGQSRPASPSDDSGRVIAGKYRLTEILGEGGMGQVWLARNIALDVDVAIKILHHTKANPNAENRLLQEARVAAQLQHPSIVRIYDFGHTDGGTPFIVMEVLDGELLSDVLARKGRLSGVNAVSTLLPVVDAVAAAHAKDVVHRDLKPDNVLLVKDDAKGSIIPKVLDFGIAKLKAEQQSDGRRLTRQRMLVGTPHYMSPEQCSWTETIDARSDVWALSVMLYELCTGTVPFDGADAHAILLSVANDEPKSLTELAAGDEELWRIVARGLEKDREYRWASARELGLALADWATRNGLDTDIAGNSIEVHWFSGGQRRPLSFPPKPTQESRERAAPTQRIRRDTDSQPHSMESGEREQPTRSRRPWLYAGAGLIALFVAGFAFGAGRVGGLSPLEWARSFMGDGTARETQPRLPVEAESAAVAPAAPTPSPPPAVAEPIASAPPPETASAAPVPAPPPATAAIAPSLPMPLAPKKKTAVPRQRTEW